MALLSVHDLSLSLPDRAAKPLFGVAPLTQILRGIDFTLQAGESLGIVGESGSGKTTLGRTLLRLYRPTSGQICFEDQDITHMSQGELRPLRSRMQMIFQDPLSSLNPRQRIEDILAQPLLAYGRVPDRSAGRQAARGLLERVGLPTDFALRYPHELSGGQRQRIGIARAIALKPRLIVADEIVSGLDVSTQAQILLLLRELKKEDSLIFISHDLSVVRVLCDRVVVLYRGEIVESGECETVFSRPRHEHTRALLAAIALPEPDPDWVQRTVAGDPEQMISVRGRSMQIKGSVALVTGASRGIGREFVHALVGLGATKVYAAARNVQHVADLVAAHPGKVEAVQVDITKTAEVAQAASQCGDVDLLINNAGINHKQGLIAAATLDRARAEIDTNYFGTLAMCRAFAPVLKANGGGALVNMLSILGRVSMPAYGSYCVSKSALYSLTQGVRAELTKQGTLVVGVMPGATDTDVERDYQGHKEKPRDVAMAALHAVEQGIEDVYPGQMADGVSAGLAKDHKAVEKEFAGYLPG